jgi:hypothetical protein
VKLDGSSESSTGQLAREELETYAKRVKSSLGSSSKSNTGSFHSILQNGEGKVLPVFETGNEFLPRSRITP